MGSNRPQIDQIIGGKTKNILEIPYLKLTANAPENGWLKNDPFLLGQTAYFQERLLLVSGRVYWREIFPQVLGM